LSDYDTDVLTWSQRQSALLRRVAAGEQINDQVDWPNIIEEVEAVGQSQVDAVESWLYQVLLHMLKASAWPLSEAVPHWQAEARGFRAQARRKYRASMAQKLDVPGLYADALYALPEKSVIDGQGPLPVPVECTVTLQDLMSNDP
jgi:hypothetical protein